VRFSGTDEILIELATSELTCAEVSAFGGAALDEICPAKKPNVMTEVTVALQILYTASTYLADYFLQALLAQKLVFRFGSVRSSRCFGYST
jgi:hypothetical protein